MRATPIAGGLSHHIWRVDTGGRSYLLRVLDPAVSAAGLGIPPEQEIENTLRAADSGAGARVIEVLPDVPALVLEFLPGRTLHADDVRDPETIETDRRRLPEAARRPAGSPTTSTSWPNGGSCSTSAPGDDLRVPDGLPRDDSPSWTSSRER